LADTDINKQLANSNIDIDMSWQLSEWLGW